MDPRPPVTAQLPPNPSPWRRFIAKWLDLLVLKYILGFFVIMALPLGSTGLYVALTLGLLFLWFAVVEPILLSTLGSTVGNALCGVVVRDLKGQILTFGAAWKRSMKVWWFGYGAGLPIIHLFCWYVAYKTLKQEGVTSWDKSNCLVTRAPGGVVKSVLLILLILVAAGLWMYGMVGRGAGQQIMVWGARRAEINESLPRMLDKNIQLREVYIGNKGDRARSDHTFTGLTFKVFAIFSDAQDLTSPVTKQNFVTLVKPVACETIKKYSAEQFPVEAVDFVLFDKNNKASDTWVEFVPSECAP